jgi:hypothetical protein
LWNCLEISLSFNRPVIITHFFFLYKKILE